MDPLPVTDELRARASVIDQRRLALQGQQEMLRLRYDEVMNWINPPFDERSRRADPRPEANNAERDGLPKVHVDWTGEAVMRWGVLQAGAMPAFRVVPRYTPPPPPADPDGDPAQRDYEMRLFELDRQGAEDQASMMEAQIREWMEYAHAHRTLLWACTAKEAFGKAILRSGWDDVARMPTLELMENPSQCTYSWTTRYGSRKLAWMIVSDQMDPAEVNFRYGLDLPVDEAGNIRYSEWNGGTSDMDARPEQSNELDRYVWVEESWELMRSGDSVSVRMDFVVGGRIVSFNEWPWKRVPFHVMENHHIPTYSHGDSMVEAIVPLNEAYDDMLDRQHAVIEFESGPRYKGLNMGMTDDDVVEMPGPGKILPLRDGEDVQQIDTRVDFWPSQVHANELKESLYFASGLTPIAWGMSPNAQTSGRALSAEWRAVELPLAARLIEMTPELIEVVQNWWDFAEAYVREAREVGEGYRRFQVVWAPLDIRDINEKILGVIQLYQADLMDPETALQELGREDVPEKIALIRKYLMDPVWNPLRYQQMLVLKQLALTIEQQEMQNAAMRQAAAPQQGGPTQQPGAEEAEQQGMNAAAQQAQGAEGPVTEGMNQPGMAPGGMPAGMPLDIGLLSRTPLENGSGNQIMIGLGGPAAAPPTNGQTPR